MAGLFSSGEQDMLGNIVQQRQQANQALGSGYGKYGGIVQAAGGLIDTGTDAMFGGKVGASDPRMQQMEGAKAIFAKVSKEMVDVTSPAFYERLATEFAAGNFPEQAEKAKIKAAELKKAEFDMRPKVPELSSVSRLMVEQANFQKGSNEYNTLQGAIDKATKDKPDSQPQIIQLQNALKTLTPGSKEFKEVQARIDALGRGNVATSTPVNIDVKDINSMRSGVRPELSPFGDVINSAQQGLSFLKLGNPKAEGQVNRSLASLSGDTQTSALEINLTSNAGPLGQQIADTISRVIVGGSGAQSKLEKQHVLEASLIHNTLKYNTKRDEIVNSYQNTNMSDKQINSIVGPPQELPKDLIGRFVVASGEEYEPSKFDYRMSSNGSIQKKAKKR